MRPDYNDIEIAILNIIQETYKFSVADNSEEKFRVMLKSLNDLIVKLLNVNNSK